MILGEVTGVAIGDDIHYHMRGTLSFGEKCFPITINVTQDYRHIAEVTLRLRSHRNDGEVVTKHLGRLFAPGGRCTAIWSRTPLAEAPEWEQWAIIFSFANTTLRTCMRKVDDVLNELHKTLRTTFRPHAATR